jgi:hypothetical protein
VRQVPAYDCKHCGIRTVYNAAQYPDRVAIYCSQACMGADRRGKPRPGHWDERVCPTCKERFEVGTATRDKSEYCRPACLPAGATSEQIASAQKQARAAYMRSWVRAKKEENGGRSPYDQKYRDAERVDPILKARAQSRSRRHSLKKKFGITEEQFFAMLKVCNSCCEICGKALSVAAGDAVKRTQVACVDHSHSTGQIRGILCYPCNTAVGQMGDSPVRLRAAAAYLERRDAEKAAE